MIKKILIIVLFMTQALSAFNQSNKMKEVKELINTEEPGWTIVSEWIKNATNKVEILPKDSLLADSALYKAQVTINRTLSGLQDPARSLC